LKEGAAYIDFDGVIHCHSEEWQNGSIYNSSMKGTREALEKLGFRGFKIKDHNNDNSA
jgi:hypothetical protein